METVAVSRTIGASPEAIRAVIRDVEPFMAAAGFDDVSVDGDRLCIENSVGLLTITLELRVLDTTDVLAYEQLDGIFEEMVTRYRLETTADGTTVTATTEFALDAPLVGPILDATIITRQRRTELENQFDYLEDVVGRSSGDDDSGSSGDDGG